MAYEKPSENPIVYTHKDFGAAFFEQNLPNAYERMYMVCRAINFDLGNYNKLYSTPDYPNKRRYVRNVFRLLDHPFAYLFWKTKPYFDSGKIRMFPFYWGLTLFMTWWVSGHTFARNAQARAVEDTYEGHANSENSIEVFDNSRMLGLFFHNSEGNSSKGLISNKCFPPLPFFCRLNYHIRDQNFRKYFAHRERRGVDLFTGKPLSK